MLPPYHQDRSHLGHRAPEACQHCRQPLRPPDCQHRPNGLNPGGSIDPQVVAIGMPDPVRVAVGEGGDDRQRQQHLRSTMAAGVNSRPKPPSGPDRDSNR